MDDGLLSLDACAFEPANRPAQKPFGNLLKRIGHIGYKKMMLDIFRIREALRERLGSRFSLREFHERFLAFGNVPPALIEHELDREWR